MAQAPLSWKKQELVICQKKNSMKKDVTHLKSGVMYPFHQESRSEKKEGQYHAFIHRYDLRIKTKRTDSEVWCKKLILKQLQLLHSLVVQANGTTLILPNVTLDRNAQGFKDQK